MFELVSLGIILLFQASSSGLFFLWSWIVRTIRRPAWWRSVPRLLRKDKVSPIDLGIISLAAQSEVSPIDLGTTPLRVASLSSCPSTRRSWSRTRLPRTVNFDADNTCEDT